MDFTLKKKVLLLQVASLQRQDIYSRVIVKRSLPQSDSVSNFSKDKGSKKKTTQC